MVQTRGPPSASQIFLRLYKNTRNQFSLHDLLADAQQYADPAWNADFYDEIAPYVCGGRAQAARGSRITLGGRPCAYEWPRILCRKG